MKTTRMPALFLGHGSPMNAIDDNAFTQTIARLGQELPKPKAILAISAHWMTQGTWVTHMKAPRTIYDFYGFPAELYEMKYPASGSPELAEKITATVQTPKVNLDEKEWGLDHGTWTLLRHLYPKADIPVVQLSLDMTQSGPFHLELGRKLTSLRDDGVLIVASGNVVHNLRTIDWVLNSKPHDWAIEFDQWVKERIDARDTKALSTDYLTTAAGKLSVPTADHYFPLLYALGTSDPNEPITHIYEGIQNASIAMRCVRMG